MPRQADRLFRRGSGIGQIPTLLKRYRAIGGHTLTLEPHLTVFDGLAQLEQPGDTTKSTNSVMHPEEEAFMSCDGIAKINRITKRQNPERMDNHYGNRAATLHCTRLCEND